LTRIILVTRDPFLNVVYIIEIDNPSLDRFTNRPKREMTDRFGLLLVLA
jgi:hypothetical protein